MNRALIVSGKNTDTEPVQRMMKAAGYDRIDTVKSGSEARRTIGSRIFELAVIFAPLTDEFGHELSHMISENASAGVILICRSEFADAMKERLSDSGVCVLPKPFSSQAFLSSLRAVESARSRMIGARRENVRLMSKIEEMRLINRAKCTLMLYLKFTEPQAHRYIEKQAMNNRRTRREVALKILSAYER